MDIKSFKKRIALIVGQSSGGDSLPNLLKLDQQLEAVKSGLQMIGFGREEIILLKNRDNLDLEEEIGLE